MLLRTNGAATKSTRKPSRSKRLVSKSRAFHVKFLLFVISALTLKWFFKILQVDTLRSCPLAISEYNRNARSRFKIFIGAGTRNYLVAAKHLLYSLEERSSVLVNHSKGVHILTSERALGECIQTFRGTQANCVRSTPYFQQTGSHPDVYNKFDTVAHSDAEDWVVYLDADMVVLEELFSVVDTVPISYLIMGVKNFPLTKRILFGQESWGVNGGFLIYNKRIIVEQQDAIQQMMRQGINDQIIWSRLFHQYRTRHGSCLLDETYNCRLNVHRLCYKRAKVAHYSSTAKRGLYYFEMSDRNGN